MSIRKASVGDGLLPKLTALPRRERTEITRFGGLSAMGKGCVSEMANLSARGCGGLATRLPRGLFATLMGSGTPRGMAFFDGSLFYVRGTKLYVTVDGISSRGIGDVSDSDKLFFVFNDRLYMYPDKLYLEREDDRLYSMELDSGVIQQMEFTGNTMTLPEGKTWGGLGFTVGDGLRVQSEDDNVPAPQGYYHIVSVRGRTATVREYLSTTLKSDARLIREVPDLDGVCVCGNRIYGIHGKDIYVSAEGSATDFRSYKGASGEGPVILHTDSEGDLTACSTWQGYVIFFKADRIYKLLGNRADTFVLQERPAVGIPASLARTLGEVGGALYYCAGGSVFRYRGQDSEWVASLAEGTAIDGCGGSDGQAYYLAICKNGVGWKQLVYQPLQDEWYVEDNLHPACMLAVEGFLYLLDANGYIWKTSSDGRSTGCRFTEADVYESWEATAVLAPDYHLQPDLHRPQGLYIRATATEGACLDVWAECADGYAGKDADGTVPVLLGRFEGKMKDRLLRMQMPSKPCDGVRVTLRMTGDWVIHSMVREYA